ncbi:MAG: uroporphyrinogen-III synthase [Xanthobacteraceae bacterium]
MRILLTRPEQQGERTAAALRARDHDVLHVPLLRIVGESDADLGAGPWSAVVMTSANAVHAIATHKRYAELNYLPAIVVGERTAEAARAAGFAHVESAGGDAEALADYVVKSVPRGRSILYLAGADRAGDLGAMLNAAGYDVSTIIVYRAVAATALPASAASALKADDVDAVLHFSRRSAETFLTLARDASCLVNVLKCKHFCLSTPVAETLAGAGVEKLFVAARPDESALLDLVGRA